MPDPHLAEADVFVAIASPVRRTILETLAPGPLPVRDLAANFSISRPAVSQHLRVLKDAGLVSEERRGRERRYRLDAEPLRDVEVWLARYEQFWPDRLRALRFVLEEEP